jgi:hypothetical protein
LGVLLAFAFVSAALADDLPKHTWADTLDLKKMEHLAQTYAKAAFADPKNFDLRVQTAIYGYFCWRLEKTDNRRRLAFATLTYRMGKEAAALRPERAEGHHWAGAGMGLVGLTRGVLNSLQLVPQGKGEMERSYEIDPTYYSGSGRANVARMLTMLPGFPVSIGDKKKALEMITPLRKKWPGATLWLLYEADLLWSFGRNAEALALLAAYDESKPTADHEYFNFHTGKAKAELLTKLITSGQPRDPFFDVLSDIQPGLVD